MFSSVRLLIALDDHDTARAIQRAAEALSFQTRTTNSISGFLNENADVLVLGTYLANGEADLCLDRWIAHSQGPVCIIGDGSISIDYENDLIARGAWNVLRRPLRLEAVQAALYRYGSIIVQRAKLTALEAKVGRMERIVIALMVLVAAFGGVEVLPWLLKFLGL